MTYNNMHAGPAMDDVIDPNGALTKPVSSLVADAARGDLQAQRRIRQAWLDTVSQSGNLPENSDLIAASGLLMARLCAANGDASDHNALAALLFDSGVFYQDAGRKALGWDLIAEAVSIYERLVTTGDEQAAVTVNGLVPKVPTCVIEQAKYYLNGGAG